MTKYLFLAACIGAIGFFIYNYIGSKFPIVVGGVILLVLIYVFVIEISEGEGIGRSFLNIIKRLFRF